MTLFGRVFRTLSKAIAAIPLLVAASAPTAPTAQTAIAPAVPARTEILIRSPQFVATAVSFKALDETGPDWPGSDEVYVVFAEFDPIRQRMSDVYGDVDLGETKTFHADDRCIAPLQQCDRGKSSLHFAVAFWERDDWTFPFPDFCPGVIGDSHVWYEDGLCPYDDLIGRVDVNLSQADLLAALPTVGSEVTYTVKESGGSGSYQLTYRVARLPDLERTIVIHIPPLDPAVTIVLQAFVENSPAGLLVRLKWTGATTSTVDVFRDGALIANTANNGTYSDKAGAGTHQYRVCNAGTSACSATVSVTVP